LCLILLLNLNVYDESDSIYLYLLYFIVWTVLGHSVMNQVHFASVEDEEDDMYSGFNDFSATDMTQASHTVLTD